MALITMDYALAMAAAHTAADLQMRRQHRTKWNLDDWNRMCEVFQKCYGQDVIDSREESK